MVRVDDADELVQTGQAGVLGAQRAQPDGVGTALQGAGLLGELAGGVAGRIGLLGGEEQTFGGMEGGSSAAPLSVTIV